MEQAHVKMTSVGVMPNRYPHGCEDKPEYQGGPVVVSRIPAYWAAQYDEAQEAHPAKEGSRRRLVLRKT